MRGEGGETDAVHDFEQAQKESPITGRDLEAFVDQGLKVSF